MSQFQHSTFSLGQTDATPATQPVAAPVEELQHINEDSAAARHLTAIRIRGQLAEFEGEQTQG